MTIELLCLYIIIALLISFCITNRILKDKCCTLTADEVIGVSFIFPLGVIVLAIQIMLIGYIYLSIIIKILSGDSNK